MIGLAVGGLSVGEFGIQTALMLDFVTFLAAAVLCAVNIGFVWMYVRESHVVEPRQRGAVLHHRDHPVHRERPAVGGDAGGGRLARVPARGPPEPRVVHRLPVGAGLPLLADRPAMGGKATAYVCRRSVCQLPVTDPAGLVTQLDAGV